MAKSSPPHRQPRSNGLNIDRSFAVEFGTGAAPVRRAPTPLARRFYQICLTMQADGIVGADLTPLQYGVLAFLNADDGEPGIDQIRLAERMGLERSHVSLLIEQLSKKSLVEQRVNDTDRRARLLFLTSKGMKLQRLLRPSIIAANARALEPLLPQERELFLDMLVRIVGFNGANARPGAGRRKRGERQSSNRDKTAGYETI
jgi:DNA-binding MarR family transcriptional regulator